MSQSRNGYTVKKNILFYFIGIIRRLYALVFIIELSNLWIINIECIDKSNLDFAKFHPSIEAAIRLVHQNNSTKVSWSQTKGLKQTLETRWIKNILKQNEILISINSTNYGYLRCYFSDVHFY